jgi:hypothetical protein
MTTRDRFKKFGVLMLGLIGAFLWTKFCMTVGAWAFANTMTHGFAAAGLPLVMPGPWMSWFFGITFTVLLAAPYVVAIIGTRFDIGHVSVAMMVLLFPATLLGAYWTGSLAGRQALSHLDTTMNVPGPHGGDAVLLYRNQWGEYVLRPIDRTRHVVTTGCISAKVDFIDASSIRRENLASYRYE